MVIDRIQNAILYRGISPRLAMALDYLGRTNFTALEPGRYDIDGDRVYALVQRRETRPRSGALWEAHRKYIDVQFLVAGVEKIGYAPASALKVLEPYEASKDAEMLKGKGDFFVLSAGGFAIFWPSDAHMPSVAIGKPQPVKKVVIKVLVD